MRKNLHIPLFIFFLFITMMLSSCEVVEAIFKTGVGIGIFVTVAVLIIIGIIVGVIRGKK